MQMPHHVLMLYSRHSTGWRLACLITCTTTIIIPMIIQITLTPLQLARTMFPVDDIEWRKWMNQHFYAREGVCFAEMTDAQRQAAFGLMRASLSAAGYELTRNIMRLNETLAELSGDHEFLG